METAVIDLRKSEKDYYQCSSCGSENNIYWVMIGQQMNYTSIKLCNECRIELIQKVNDVTEGKSYES